MKFHLYGANTKDQAQVAIARGDYKDISLWGVIKKFVAGDFSGGAWDYRFRSLAVFEKTPLGFGYRTRYEPATGVNVGTVVGLRHDTIIYDEYDGPALVAEEPARHLV